MGEKTHLERVRDRRTQTEGDRLMAESLVAAYDQRDAGQSTHFPDTGAASPIAAVLRRRSPAYTAEDMTDDAVAVLDALGWDPAHLFGHSMGGQLAQRTALPRRSSPGG